MTPIRPHMLLSFAGAGLIAASACAGPQPGSEGATISQETDACPDGSQGCVCAPSNPQRQKLWVPSCEADADCPAAPDGASLQCQEGVCVPERQPPPPPGPRPKHCETET